MPAGVKRRGNRELRNMAVLAREPMTDDLVPLGSSQSIKRHSGRKLRGRVAPDRGFGGWGCPGPLALTGVGDQLTGALSRTQSTHKPRVFDKNQTSLHASSHWTLPARIRDHAAASINHRIACLYFDKGCWWRELPSANASSFQQGLSNDRACAAAFPQIAAF